MSLDPPLLNTMNDPSDEPLYEVTQTNTLNDGRWAHGMVMLDPITGFPMVPGDVTLTSLSLADGADVAEGSTTDSAGDPTVVGQLKAISANTTGVPVPYYTHTFVAGGIGSTVDASADPVIGHSLQVSGVGAAAGAWDVALQASLDNINWANVLTHVNGSQANGAIVHTVAYPAVYLRAVVNSVTLGSASGLQVTFLGKS